VCYFSGVFTYPKTYDVIVVGAGHAGIEAALAASRMGCSTLLTSMDLDTVGKMSCNPAIGGLAKGHLVREIDSLGGQMAQTTDSTAIQFRMLNRSKGSAVWAPRAQCDKKSYQVYMKSVCERTPNLDLKQAQATAVVLEGGALTGIDTAMDVRYLGRIVILTTGTFLRGLMHYGMNQQKGGRAGEQASYGLSTCLKEMGFELVRLKTGTPPRISRHSINFEGLEVQPGDDPPTPFSFLNEASYRFHGEQFHGERWVPALAQVPCFLTRTTLATAEIIRSNLHKSPMYSGIIEGIGPRYCPSIEDKIVRFPDKETHQIFLEPEGLQTDEFYVNGVSTSLPFDVQIAMIRSIAGLEKAEIMRAGYAVEYDCSPPTQLYPWLETKRVENLFFAGQINGTSGYEEAAGQGLVAGINAGLRIQGKQPNIFDRSESYLGVMIDDLVTKGAPEPYRMFTSRAEYRLFLRQDNADIRMTPFARKLGLVDEPRWRGYQNKLEQISRLKQQLSSIRVNGVLLEKLLKQPEMSLLRLKPHVETDGLPEDVRNAVEMDVKYEGYLQKQLDSIARHKRMEGKRIPATFDYGSIRALRKESQQRLLEIRPQTVGQASRISGITPADVEILLVYLRKGELSLQT
jgi:tRNA uridine 5-carboxymethylaminomethyl modification enzyme